MTRRSLSSHEKPLPQSSRGLGNPPLRRKHQSANDPFSHCHPAAFHENHQQNKLGIYLGIGTGAAPALFELDTGATGFYATYSPNQGVSPWWGSNVTSLNTPVDTSYASGLHYTGALVEAPITFLPRAIPLRPGSQPRS